MTANRKFWILAPLLLVAAGAAVGAETARYTPSGAFIPPADYREWIFLSSGLNMNYGDEPVATGLGLFDNVFVDPAAWRVFKATGHWPDKTVFVKEGRAAGGKGSINDTGQFQTESRAYLEFHVRDEKRFKGGWGFFESADGKPSRLIPHAAKCYACHEANAALETTFVQFYPTAKPIALKARSYHER